MGSVDSERESSEALDSNTGGRAVWIAALGDGGLVAESDTIDAKVLVEGTAGTMTDSSSFKASAGAADGIAGTV